MQQARGKEVSGQKRQQEDDRGDAGVQKVFLVETPQIGHKHDETHGFSLEADGLREDDGVLVKDGTFGRNLRNAEGLWQIGTEILGKDATVFYQRGVPTLGEIADATVFSTEATGKQPGVRIEAFNNPSLAGKPVLSRIDQHINIDHGLGDGLNQNAVSARWTGYFAPDRAGEYLIFTQGPGEGGGVRLYVDDKLVIDNWDRANAIVSQVRMPLALGAHKMRFESFVHEGGSTVRLGVARPDALVNTEAKELASRADAVVLSVGFDGETESEGSDRSFELLPGQDELINQIAAVNKNTVVVVTSGGAVDMNRWIKQVPALVESWYPGQEGGTALAQLLFGEYSPSGKLPVTFEHKWQDSAVYDSYYPRPGQKKVVYSEGVFLGYRHFDGAGIQPMFPFGYGLSYTKFAYKNLSVTPATAVGEQPVTVSFDVTNAGDRAGAEVAEVYVGALHPHMIRPVKELKGFAKTYLAPGETKRIAITLDSRAFSYYDTTKHRWMTEPGDNGVYVGGSVSQIELTGKVELQASE
jgi:beta-glucosidase